MRKIIVAKSSLLLFVIFLTIFFLSNCKTECNNEQIKSINLHNKYKAIAFIRDCGATTDFSPQVSILLKNEEFTNENLGNTFIANHSSFIDISWIPPNTLVIIHNCKRKDIFKLKNKKYGFNIKYKLLSRENN